MRGGGGKGAVERTHRGARRAYDNNFAWHLGPLNIDRGTRAASFSAILALAIAANEPGCQRCQYHTVSYCLQFSSCNFRAKLLRFLAAALRLYPYTDAKAARARKGQTRFVPVKILGAINTNPLRFDIDVHASRNRSWPRTMNPSRSKNTPTGGSTIPPRAPISRSRTSPPWSRKAMISWSSTPKPAMTLRVRC